MPITHIPWLVHSVLSLIFGLIFGVRWGRRCAIVLALVSFSHWLLDLVVHRHDMPILPRRFWQPSQAWIRFVAVQDRLNIGGTSSGDPGCVVLLAGS